MPQSLKKAVTPYVTLNDVSENDILETFGLNEKGMIKNLLVIIGKMLWMTST